MKKALARERQGFFSRRLLQAYIGQRNDNADCRDDGGDCVDREHRAYGCGESPRFYGERINQQKDDGEDFHLREQNHGSAEGHRP